MKTIVSGSSGLVGSALVLALTKAGHDVIRLVRRHEHENSSTIFWSPDEGEIDADSCDNVETVVHLAGENIAAGRWSPARKQLIRDSRVDSTRLLAETMAACENPPKTMVVASAVGYYGNRGDDLLHEDTSPGEGFLADVCREWEDAAQPAIDRGIRVVKLRIGVVLSPKGGALAKILPAYKMSLGGTIGTGREFMSWLTLKDLVDITLFAIDNEAISGPVNAVSPHPVTSAEFAKTMGRVLGKPTFLPVPAFALKVVFGEMAKETLLSSTRVAPSKLEKHGFQFTHPDLETALRGLLG